MKNLPQLNRLFITDGGLETTAIFLDGIELPALSAVSLVRTQEGLNYLRNYFHEYIELAKLHKVGLILETPTWRATSDWVDEIGVHSFDELLSLTRKSVEFLAQIKKDHITNDSPLVIAGCVGPRRDGYVTSNKMDVNEAYDYHFQHINALWESGCDFISVLTMNYMEEALGIIKVCEKIGAPVAVSFTVETDGNLIGGESYIDTIQTIDSITDQYPSYYMINCAHPTHVHSIFSSSNKVLDRIGGIRANASCKSHAELNESETLDIGNPQEFGSQICDLNSKFGNIKVLGGCCGSDIRHIREICKNL